jgi:hypothetical protein
MQRDCDWALVVYAGGEAAVRALCHDPRVRHRFVHCARSPATRQSWEQQEHLRLNVGNPGSPRNVSASASGRSGAGAAAPVRKRVVPKSVLYQELLPYLPSYKRVFLLDEDIHLEGFNYTRFSRTWDCAFPDPPLVVQPLIAESKQDYDFLNANSWIDKSRRNVLASGVGYVERQTPLLDSVFFEWLVSKVLSRTKSQALKHEVDWGANRIWCNAAQMYAREVLGLGNLHRFTACAVVTGSMVHHLDGKSLHNKHSSDRRAFMMNGQAFVQTYVNLFPTWTLLDAHTVSPLLPQNKHRFPQVTSFTNPACGASD